METHEEVLLACLPTGPQRVVSEYRRFAMLVLGSFGCTVCSFNYAWNLIAPNMQSRYNFSQRDMSSIVTVGIVFQTCALPFAFLYDYLGPVPVSIIATVEFPLGTLLLALCFMGVIEGSVVRLCVFNALMANGCILFDLLSCVTVLSHFPSNRGPVVALLKTFTGLGSAIVACLYAGFFKSDPKKHYLFLCSVAIVVGALCIAFMRLPPYHLTQYEEKHLSAEEKERRVATKAQYLRQEAPLRRFVWGFVILVVLIIFLPTQSALVSYLRLGRSAKLAFAIVTTVVVLLYTLVAAPLLVLNSSTIPFLRSPGRPSRRRSLAAEGAAAAAAPFQLSSPLPPRREDDATCDGVCGGNRVDVLARELELENTLSVTSCTPGECGSMGVYLKCPLLDDAASVRQALAEQEETGAATAADAAAVASASASSSALPPPPPTAAATELELDYLAPQYQGSFVQNLATVELWALWWTLFTVAGGEAVLIYNSVFIMAALQAAPVDRSLNALLTVLNGVGSAVGRLMTSYFEVWSQKRKAEDRVPITLALFFPTGSFIASLVLFLTLPAPALPLPYVVSAIGNGFLAGVMLLLTRTIFARDPAKHYNFCFTAALVAAIVHNRFLYGEWYTVQAEKQGHKVCYGKRCVLMPFLVMLGLACTAFVTDLIFHLRYQSFCAKALAERARLLMLQRSRESHEPADASATSASPPSCRSVRDRAAAARNARTSDSTLT
ncbi:Protein Associated with Differentiation [Novymonas esmeraldas]|uniref:Protein Associated with Differentiation n=1 Tax=Novymonas esmeraldas TaxID=1808958 RepID=A0AAW0F126_9TRYP